MSQNETVLEVRNLHTGFTIDSHVYNAVKGISFDIKRGEIVCIVGESGCGKSVLSLSIMHLLPKDNAQITDGEIFFENQNITSLTEVEMNRIRGKHMSMIFQEPMTALNPVLTIGSQIDEVLLNHTMLSKKQVRAKSISLLKQVGISRSEQIVNEYPHQLSGGMRQRVMIAMAIACEPKLLIADEPTTALDVTVQAQILDLIKSIQQERGMAVMLVTHDLGVVAEMADRVIVMYAGEIVEQTDVESLFYTPKHPYTKLLLNSIPKLDHSKEILHTIKGIVPSLTNMSKVGCRFADRCPEAMSQCHTTSPQLGKVEKEHLVRCLLYHASYPEQIAEV